jgi:predicted RNA-binding Zn-ribbon protein involved in translation (DUF1610 family)
MGGSQGMNVKDSTHGLSCPNCGGMVEIPEGRVIVICPYCQQRSIVRGERGVQRYQVPVRIQRDALDAALRKFFTSHRAIAGDVAFRSLLDEAFIACLPFWTSWARVLGWVLGEKKVRSGDNTRYEPREIQVLQDSTWNGAACDVGEFGVEAVPLGSQPLEPFNAGILHQSGMVFEPVNSLSEAQQQAQDEFLARVQRSANLDRISQVFVRMVRRRFGLVYYPLWILRYQYRGRSFQVAVDGFSGEVLYGKAPGNTFYRAAVLVGGMAVGSLMSVDLAPLLAYLGSRAGDDAGGLIVAALVVLLAGFGVMAAAYRSFRYGEQYEYRRHGKSKPLVSFEPQDIFSQIKDVEKWIDRLT